MRRNISDWCKACPQCQPSKISRRNHLLPAQFTAPDGRFRHVHMDIVGPLPESNGFKYCLTFIDHFSRWPEAVLLQNTDALTVSRAFVNHWISRYGSPETLTTDQGSQFESQLFSVLLQLIGCNRIRTTAYHPAAGWWNVGIVHSRSRLCVMLIASGRISSSKNFENICVKSSQSQLRRNINEKLSFLKN